MTAFRSAMEHLARYASDTQIGRFQHQMGILFMAWSQEADWHRNGRTPPVWEYLVQRHLNSYLPPMILIDVVAGYELPPHEFYDPMVRRAFTRAGARERAAQRPALLGVRVGDRLQPAARDRHRGRLLARGRRSSAPWRSTTSRCARSSRRRRPSALTGSPALQRFFVDTWAWMGGSREWHATTGRYHSDDA